MIRDTAKLLEKNCGAKCAFVATHENHPQTLSPQQCFEKAAALPDGDVLFFVSWGPLVEKHVKLIRSHNPNARIIYYAQSFGWGVRVPARVPIVCVSRYVMAQFALHAPENYCAYIPPPLNPCFMFGRSARDIDILAHARKQNEYCLQKLVPALQKENLRIEVLRDWIPQEKFAALLNRAKIFLYVTAPHKAGFFKKLPGEGFGLPALEALACGALVGSNLLGGVTDFLTPGENCIKLQNGNLAQDIAQIKTALAEYDKNAAQLESEKIIEFYSANACASRWIKFLTNKIF